MVAPLATWASGRASSAPRVARPLTPPLSLPSLRVRRCEGDFLWLPAPALDALCLGRALPPSAASGAGADAGAVVAARRRGGAEGGRGGLGVRRSAGVNSFLAALQSHFY